MDFGACTMERINAINAILRAKDEYNLSHEEFVNIISLLNNVQDLPSNTPRCEDILFESIVVTLKNSDQLSKWVGGKIGQLMKKHQVWDEDRRNSITSDAIDLFKNNTSFIHIFLIYAHIEQQVVDDDIPSISAINTVQQIVDQSMST